MGKNAQSIMQSEVIIDEKNSPIQMRGTVQDITEAQTGRGER